MQIIRINSSELAQMQKLGRGACSVIYKYGEDLVIKILNEKGMEMHDEEQFSNIIGIENSTCVFPKDRVEVDGTFQGYTMDYVQGEPLHESIKRMNFSTLISAIKEVESDLIQLSTHKILFQDLNEGGIMWDNVNGRIKIIDTDFFQKNENIEQEQCYSANIESFNSIIEMELSILNGQGTKLSEYLHINPEFSKLYTKYMMDSLKGKNMSVTELIVKAVEIFEKDYGIKVNSIEEMQQLIGERIGGDEIKSDISEEIPIFEPPKDSKQNKMGIRQKIVNFIANNSLLKKFPFINKFLLKGQNLLSETNKLGNNTNEKTRHDKFVEKLSNYGDYIDIKNLKSQAIGDQEKLNKMKKKIRGKSLDGK